MQTRLPLLLAGLITLGLTGRFPPLASEPGRPPDARPARLRLVPAPDGNEARYRVREQLVDIDFPSDAVGSTRNITGGITLDSDGTIVLSESKFVVDLTTLTSDRQMRDRYLRRNTLQTDQFPEAVFVPATFKGLAKAPPPSADATFQLRGDFTVRGITRPITWDVTLQASGSSYAGIATTAFTFADFGMSQPRVRLLLSVKDTIRLEYDFHLVPGTL